MKYITILAAALLLGGCAIFSTPGRVTSQEGTSEAGGVYLHVIQQPNGCPSAIAFGAQTMGGIDATCTDGGKTQTIHATAPDPNPALTTAYAGITQMNGQLLDFAKSLITAAAGAASPMPLAARSPMGLAPRSTVVAPSQLCPPGTLPTSISGAGTTCQ